MKKIELNNGILITQLFDTNSGNVEMLIKTNNENIKLVFTDLDEVHELIDHLEIVKYMIKNGKKW